MGQVKMLKEVVERKKKVDDLAKALKGAIEVVMASDAEGNDFHRLEDFEVMDDGRIVLWPEHNRTEY